MNTYRDDIYLAANGVIVSYQGTEKEIEIPSRLADSNINQIGIGAFMDDENLREVIIPETVEVIKEKAFFNDDNLRKIVMNRPVTEVGERAFDACERIDFIRIKFCEIDIAAYNSLKNSSLKTTNNTYLARSMPDKYIPKGLIESMGYKPAVYIPEDVDYLYHTFYSEISEKSIVDAGSCINSNISCYGLEFKEGVSNISEEQNFINHKDKKEVSCNIIPKGEEKNDVCIRDEVDLNNYLSKVLLFILDDNETIVKGNKCYITYNIHCGFYFWQTSQKVIINGKDYYIYVRKYLSSNPNMPYVKEDVAIFHNDTYVTDEVEAKQVYGKYRLLSIL